MRPARRSRLHATIVKPEVHYFKVLADLAASDDFTGEKTMEISRKFDTNFPVAH